MSVGEAQLISLARMLMRKDEVAVVVMDEASSPFLCKPTVSHLRPCMRYVSRFLSSDQIMRSKELEMLFMLILSIIHSL